MGKRRRRGGTGGRELTYFKIIVLFLLVIRRTEEEEEDGGGEEKGIQKIVKNKRSRMQIYLLIKAQARWGFVSVIKVHLEPSDSHSPMRHFWTREEHLQEELF